MEHLTVLNKKIKFRVFLPIIVLAIILASTVSYFAVQAALPTVIISTGMNISEASYIILVDGTTYYVRDGITGALTYSGASAYTAISTALAAGTGKVVVRAGDYYISTTIDISTNDWLCGEGYGKTNLISSAALTPVVHLSGQYAMLSDITVDCNSGQSVDGVHMHQDNTRLFQVEVIEPSQDGIVLGDGSTTYLGGRVELCRISVLSGNTRYGIFVQNDFSDFHLFGNLVRAYNSATGSACLALSERDGIIIENHFWGSYYGILISAPVDGVTITGNFIDDNYYNNIYVAYRLSHSMITNNRFRWASKTTLGAADSIAIDATFSTNTITGNFFTGSTTSAETARARYAIYASGTYGSYCTVTGNVFRVYDGAAPYVRLAGAGNEYAANIGYTE